MFHSHARLRGQVTFGRYFVSCLLLNQVNTLRALDRKTEGLEETATRGYGAVELCERPRLHHGHVGGRSQNPSAPFALCTDPIRGLRAWPIRARRAWPLRARRAWPIRARRAWPIRARRAWPLRGHSWPLRGRRAWPLRGRRAWPARALWRLPMHSSAPYPRASASFQPFGCVPRRRRARPPAEDARAPSRRPTCASPCGT